MKCKICQNAENNTVHTAKEMFFGLGDEFEYFQCSNCGCLQIKDIPENLSKYYPENYYSYNFHPGKKLDGIAWQFKLYDLVRKDKIKLPLFLYKNAFKRLNVNILNSIPEGTKSILDVGCGNGFLLYCLKLMGYEKLVGVDLFIEKDIHYKNGVTVFKKNLLELDGKFDFIMLHHSFEHMKEQTEIMAKIHDLLNDTGTCLLRIPIAGYAWEKYGTDWVQLDAPRHFFLHSQKSIEILAEKAGLSIEKVVYDSTAFQFTGSEQYKAGIPLIKQKKSSFFSKNERKEFEQKATELNRSKTADQACFYLKKL